jgi:aspartyl protease family protein
MVPDRRFSVHIDRVPSVKGLERSMTFFHKSTICVLLWIPLTANAASFNCSKAFTLIEVLICTNSDLSLADEEMASLYAKAKKTNPNIKAEQKYWLMERNACEDADCLRKVITNRNNALAAKSSANFGNEHSYSRALDYSNTPAPVINQHSDDAIHGSAKDETTNQIFQNEIKLTQNGGVYEVPISINDVLKISVILDSGAADVSIAPDVALTLIRTGTIEKSDWLPGQIYTFGDGSKAESARFNLKSISIGNKTFNKIACSISNNVNAPMLLGQSVLKRLGRYTIDYNKGVIQFE